jgi:hypothetical protein
MKINPFINEFERVTKAANQSQGDNSFAKALEELTCTKPDEHTEFLKGLSDNLQARIAYYQNTSQSEDHETYIGMMKYFAENNKEN